MVTLQAASLDSCIYMYAKAIEFYYSCLFLATNSIYLPTTVCGGTLKLVLFVGINFKGFGWY